MFVGFDKTLCIADTDVFEHSVIELGQLPTRLMSMAPCFECLENSGYLVDPYQNSEARIPGR